MRPYLAAAGVTAAFFGLAGLINCGSTTVSSSATGTTSGSSSSSSSGSASYTSTEPVSAPTNGVAPDGTGSVVMAISKLYLGDTDPNGTPDPTNGWQNYGFDIDHQNDTATTANHCKPAAGAEAATVFPNGPGGIDNSFGHNILSIITSIDSGASTTINQSIAAGHFTVMIEMEKLGTGANYTGITSQLFAGGTLGSTPKFDGTDVWPVLPSLLAANSPEDAGAAAYVSQVIFPASYTNNNTWVSGAPPGTLTLQLTVSSYTLNLTIQAATISVLLDPTHKTGSKGIIGGVLNTAALASEIQNVAGSFDAALCSGSTIDSILAEIEQASDIGSDGKQDPTKTCDGISIGLGFDAAAVQLGPVAPPPTPKANPCSDAGAGGSSGG